MKDVEKAFNEFWELYPHGRRTSKIKCKIKYEKLFKVGEHLKIIKALTLQIKAYNAKVKANWKFIPEWKLTLTWLNGGCWEDDIEMPKIIPLTKEFQLESQKSKKQKEYERKRRLQDGEKGWESMAHALKISIDELKKKYGVKE